MNKYIECSFYFTLTSFLLKLVFLSPFFGCETPASSSQKENPKTDFRVIDFNLSDTELTQSFDLSMQSDRDQMSDLDMGDGSSVAVRRTEMCSEPIEFVIDFTDQQSQFKQISVEGGALDGAVIEFPQDSIKWFDAVLEETRAQPGQVSLTLSCQNASLVNSEFWTPLGPILYLNSTDPLTFKKRII